MLMKILISSIVTLLPVLTSSKGTGDTFYICSHDESHLYFSPEFSLMEGRGLHPGAGAAAEADCSEGGRAAEAELLCAGQPRPPGHLGGGRGQGVRALGPGGQPRPRGDCGRPLCSLCGPESLRGVQMPRRVRPEEGGGGDQGGGH